MKNNILLLSGIFYFGMHGSVSGRSDLSYFISNNKGLTSAAILGLAYTMEPIVWCVIKLKLLLPK